MKRTTLCLALASTLAAPGLSVASTPRTWRVGGVEGWTAAERESVGVTSEGLAGARAGRRCDRGRRRIHGLGAPARRRWRVGGDRRPRHALSRGRGRGGEARSGRSSRARNHRARARRPRARVDGNISRRRPLSPRRRQGGLGRRHPGDLHLEDRPGRQRRRVSRHRQRGQALSPRRERIHRAHGRSRVHSRDGSDP